MMIAVLSRQLFRMLSIQDMDTQIIFGIGLAFQKTHRKDRIHFERVPEGVADPDSQVGTQVLSDAVESLIKRYPEQYFWNYRRFRRRPPGEPPLYPRRRHH